MHYALDVDFILRAVQVAHVKYIVENWGNYNLLEGTKTALDQKSGASDKRIRALLKAYRKDLPWFLGMSFGIYSMFARVLPLFIKWVNVLSRKYLGKA
jgi:hypothetical protein